ncbi:MAG: dephospho-CoA kinase [Bdellovibrionales bacterium RIFOXYB1_FULL_37_110]|nr:MAG: dephospho-CoA kinase [Bdellovibrionales bacterium RIFOXYC1_FULL_37_79]OFZ59262.1 MAG: dephospho-CoA kinase [Bdellovibrionales bacterium RIFOXYB1_FULL_37_110]OFZ62888.1 MAG: dephospho-CoA kinase [Bdellovibrionales bacterium RIFOXYD1_FULL_36_51]OFZ66902.1 MAG: dephospho-CoA kinase [Bdellovibrionales bacterium RIFOXYB2_FULL_36_6]
MNKLSKENRIYQLDVPVIGLTGGVATGKTTVSNYLKEKGHLVICADELIKKIYKQTETLDFIEASYPQVIHNGQIDFRQLRKLFFSNLAVQNQIENHLYPKLQIEFFKAFSKTDRIFYDVPLLFEKKLDKLVDITICVYINPDIQRQRLIKRDSISAQDASLLLNAQMSIEEKRKLADFVIDNSKQPRDTFLQVDAILKILIT